MTRPEDANKALVVEAFNTLFNERDLAAAERLWSPNYVEHSAHIEPGRAGFFDLVRASPDLRYEHQLVVAGGDYVLLHGRFSNTGQPVNRIVIDVVRIADGLLAEHWDVVQDEATGSQSRSGMPMYGDTFPSVVPGARRADDVPARSPSPDGVGGSSLLLQAFVGVLKARSAPVDDTAGTRDFNAGQQIEGVTRSDADLGGVPAITLEPRFNHPDRTVVYFHGGGYVSGSPPDRYLPLAAAVALAANARVHAVDYRLAPETPFPGAFDDCLAAYRWLINEGAADPATVALLGDSAGGNLAVAVTVAARDEGLALPASVAVISPFADLTFTGASISQRKEMDPYVTRELLESMAAAYVGEGARNDPRCSAVFADLHGLPPLFIQVGENEILYDDATRIRDAALSVGVAVTFESWRHGIHDWPVYILAGVPESAIAIDHLAAFLRAHTNPGTVAIAGAPATVHA